MVDFYVIYENMKLSEIYNDFLGQADDKALFKACIFRQQTSDDL